MDGENVAARGRLRLVGAGGLPAEGPAALANAVGALDTLAAEMPLSDTLRSACRALAALLRLRLPPPCA